MRTKLKDLPKSALIIAVVMCCFSCLQKGVDKTHIDIEKQTISIRSYIRDRDLTWIYFKNEDNIRLKDVDSIVKLREKQLDSILIIYRTLQ